MADQSAAELATEALPQGAWGSIASGAGIDWNRQAAPLLKAALSTVLRQADPSAARAAYRAPLDKVELSCQPVEGPDTDVSTTVQHLRVTLSGVVTVDDNICIREILQRWASSTTLAGYALVVDEADTQLHLLPTPYHYMRTDLKRSRARQIGIVSDSNR